MRFFALAALATVATASNYECWQNGDSVTCDQTELMPKICAGNFGAGPFKLYQKGANCKISFKTSKGWMTQPGKCAEGPCGDPNFKKNCPKLKCREQISCSG